MTRKTSENRDPAQTLASELGLTGHHGHYGPDEFVQLIPSEDADHLAASLADKSLEPLRQALAEQPNNLRVRDLREGVVKAATFAITAASVPESIDRHGLMVGLPFILSICPALTGIAAESIAKRKLPTLNLDRRLRADLGMELVAQETWFWQLASMHGGPASVLPFASRIRALRWFWEPREGRKTRPTVCIRCGWLLVTRAQRSRSVAPLCHHCVKSPALERQHAIAPADRGTWWLWCQAEGCTNAFEGRAQAWYCPDHRSSKLTPRRRRSRQPPRGD